MQQPWIVEQCPADRRTAPSESPLQFDWGEGPRWATVVRSCLCVVGLVAVPVVIPAWDQTLGRHYGCKVESCVPYDPESKGGAEATVKIAKADLVPTSANLRVEYGSFAELEQACIAWCEKVNARVHRETRAVPADRLAVEREHLHRLADRAAHRRAR